MPHPSDPYHPRGSEPSFSGVFSRTFLLALLAGIVVYLLWRDFIPRSGLDPDAEPRAVTARGELAQDEDATIALFEAASPSVVHINTAQRAAVREGLFSTNILEIPEGSGSGFVWDTDGHIVTNYHVLEDADVAEVRLNDQSVFRARFVGGAPEFDLAVIQIDAPSTRLVPIPVGTSEDLRVGQKAFAIGNPFGLDQTLTTGVISGLDREIMSLRGRAIRGVIQTDAAINPGNSGGPLLDSAGRLIGVNTAIKSPSGAYAGVGFAVPVDTINRIVPRLIRTGQAPRAGLGVILAPDAVARRRGWQGALVDRLAPGGAARDSGILGTRRDQRGETQFGDLIVAVDGAAVGDNEELQTLLEAYDPGDTVEIELVRAPEGEARRVRLSVQLRAL